MFLLASPVFVKAGYTPVQPPQPTDNPAKIEVIDFFYYTCPHCFCPSSPLDAWAKKLPEDVFRRVPVTWQSGPDESGPAVLYPSKRQVLN